MASRTTTTPTTTPSNRAPTLGLSELPPPAPPHTPLGCQSSTETTTLHPEPPRLHSPSQVLHSSQHRFLLPLFPGTFNPCSTTRFSRLLPTGSSGRSSSGRSGRGGGTGLDSFLAATPCPEHRQSWACQVLPPGTLRLLAHSCCRLTGCFEGVPRLRLAVPPQIGQLLHQRPLVVTAAAQGSGVKFRVSGFEV